jgi:TonB-linked SusC/RagA family outer membrane protein
MKKTITVKRLLLKAMRITVTQLLFSAIFCVMSFASGTHAQEVLRKEISLQMESAEIKQVLRLIEKQANIKFVYSTSSINSRQKITVNVSNRPLSKVLDELLTPLQVKYEVMESRILLKKKPFESFILPPSNPLPDRNVTGKVVDEKGEGLPGVSILIKQTQQGTTTDVSGDFKINVPNDQSVLVFSFMGYASQEVAVGTRSALEVRMAVDAKSLTELVVTGYSTQSKRDITGAVATIDAQELSKVTAPNLAQQLQGRAAGVTVISNNTPGGEATVRIRGFGSINNNDPLYVIDGVPTKGGLNSINPNNIESMQILKDASSASIYGSRASNGVIIITTKKGRIGQPRFTLNMRYGVQTSKSKLDLIINPQQHGDLLWTQLRNAGQLTNGNPSHIQYGNGPSAIVPDYILAGNRYGLSEGDPAVDPAKYNYSKDGFYQITKANKQGTDWYKEILAPAPVQEYNIGASGGTETGRYALSMNYFNQDGTVKNTSFNRLSLRANSEFTIRKKLRIGENLEVSYIKNMGYFQNNGPNSSSNNGDSNPIGYAYRIPTIIPVHDIRGNWAGTIASGFGPSQNPVTQLYRAKDNNTKTLRTFGNVYAEWDVIDHLTARTSFGFDYNNANRTEYNYIETEKQEGSTTNSLVNGNVNESSWTWSNTVNYSRTFGERHNLNVLAGTEAINTKGRSFQASRSNFFAQIPDYMVLNSGTSNLQNAGDAYEWALFSVFGKLNYSYDQRYLFEATVRRDGSSRFGQNNRYGVFPAFSAGWRLSQEKFLTNASWLNDLKFRAGWGQTGNQEIGNYNGFNTYRTSLGLSSYDINGTNNSVVSGFDTQAIGNPDAKWETTTQTNIGIDATILKGKFGFNVDLFNRKTSDMLYQLGLPAIRGEAVAPFVNVGQMTNKGVDIGVNFNDKSESGDFTYGVDLNFSTYKNEVTKLSSLATSVLLGPTVRSYVYTRSVTGMPLYSFYGLQIDGIYQNEADLQNGPTYPGYAAVGKYKYKDIDGNGVINDNDRTFIGNPHPDFTYGVNVHLGYKSFDLSAFLQGVQGNDMINISRRWLDFNQQAGNRSLKMLNESWTPEKPDSPLPILDASDNLSQQPSSYFVEDGSYARLKNLQIGYNVPALALKKMGLETARIYVQAQNLFTITKYTGLDPEVSVTGSGVSSQMGVDQGVYPASKIYQVGLNIGF